MHSFRTSRRYSDEAVRTRTRLTVPSPSGKVSSTMAFGHAPRFEFSPQTSTRSPTLRLRRGCNHFCRRCRSGKYSFIHRRQNKSARSCTALQERRYSSAWKNTWGGNEEAKLPQSSDIGVKAERSSGESLTGVNGRVFIIHSTSTSKVYSDSSLKVLS